MSSVKWILGNVLRKLGYSFQKVSQSAFPDLEKAPRFVEHTTKLLGNPFRIGDCASFLASYREIFRERIYDFKTGNRVPRIIDCGANYGVSVLYFKNMYPSARITAVEADDLIFAMLRDNVRQAGFSDVELLHRAISHVHGNVTFYAEGADGGRSHALDCPKRVQIVEALTLDDLIDGWTDFLKIDIEGAESAALGACTKLDQVGQMFIEYHSFEDSAQQLSQLLSLLERCGFRYYIQTQFCARRPLTKRQTHLGMDLQLNIFATRYKHSSPP